MQVRLSKANTKVLKAEAKIQARSLTWVVNSLISEAIEMSYVNKFGKTKIRSNPKPK